MLMLFFEFITWWYGRGFTELFIRVGFYIKTIWRKFSVTALTRTMFDPWRRITTDTNKSLQGMGRAVVDNMVSRLVGFVVRLFTILSAVVCVVFIGVASLIFIICWPLAPILVILSVVGIFL